MYARGGQYLVMREWNDIHGGTYYVPFHDNLAATDSIEEAREQLEDIREDEDPANPQTYKIFKLTPVED